jgi:uncharacterized delta-60 repeat protein
MAKTLQFRRGTTSELSTVTGAVGELFVDTQKDTVVVMDGSTSGGFPLQKELVSGTNIKTINGTTLLGSGDIDLSTSLTLVGNELRYTNIDGTLQTIDLSLYLDDTTNTVISGTLSGNTITFTREDDTTFTVDVSALYDDTNLVTSVNGSTGAVTVQATLVSGTNIKTINGTSLLGSGDIEISGGSGDTFDQSLNTTDNVNFNKVTVQTSSISGKVVTNEIDVSGPIALGGNYGNSGQILSTTGTGTQWIDVPSGGGEGGTVDLSQIEEDVLPVFSDVYDIGSADKRWYDGYYANKVDINGAEILGSEDGVVIDSSLLVDKLLISDNLITPDDSSRRQYSGDKGVVVINGNLDVDGDWALMPVVESTPFIEGNDPSIINPNFDAPGIEGFSVTTVSQYDGKLLLIGTSNTTYRDVPVSRAIFRVNQDGSPDSTFNTSGFGVDVGTVKDAIIDTSSNRIYIGGTFRDYNGVSIGRGVAALTLSGVLDTSFNTGSGLGAGFDSYEVNTIALQPDGALLVGGRIIQYNGTTVKNLFRVLADGSLDTSFDIGSGPSPAPDAFFQPSSVTDIALQADGKILVAGDFNSWNGETTLSRVVRLNSDGSVDNTFSLEEIASSIQSIKKVHVLPDGKILIAGFRTNFAPQLIFRLNSDGSVDNTFGNPIFTRDADNQFPDINDFVVQSDGTIVVVGIFQFINDVGAKSIATLSADGSLIYTFGTGLTRFQFNSSSSGVRVSLAADESLYIFGNFAGIDGQPAINFVSTIGGEYRPDQPATTPLTTGSEGMIRYNQDISAFQGYNGSSWELLERVTTPPTTLTKDNSGYVDIDFTGAMLGTYTETGDAVAFAFRGNNYLAGSSVTIRVINTRGDTIGLNFPTGWVFVGTKPTELAAGKTAILTVTSFGTTEEDCVAAWGVQE